jgi:hypothetical protein
MTLEFSAGITASESETVTTDKITGDAGYFPDLTAHLHDVHVEHIVLLTTHTGAVYQQGDEEIDWGGQNQSLVLSEDRMRMVGVTRGELRHLSCHPYADIDFVQLMPKEENLIAGVAGGLYLFKLATSEDRANVDAAFEYLVTRI